jgi:DNA-binding Xre family transcriptional regulator
MGRMIQLRKDALRKWPVDMTHADLAKKAGVSRRTINRIKQGHAESVTFDTGNRIAKALEVDPEVLVSFGR